MNLSKPQILDILAGILALLSSYTKLKIIELVQYSDDTNLQLAALLSAGNKDVLASEIVAKLSFLNQHNLESALFTDIKTVEKLIDYVYENQG